MSLPAQINTFSTTIARRDDGLKAFLYSTNFGQTSEMQLFSRASNMRTFGFTGMPQINSLVAEFADDAIVLADVDGKGIRVCEYKCGSSTPRDQITFGNQDSQDPAILRLKNGGLVIVAYRNDSSITIDAAFRAPITQLALPGQKWSTATFALVPGPVGIPPLNIALVEGADGLIYCFFTRDSSHTVKLLRFDTKLRLVDYDDSFLSDYTTNGVPASKDASPDGEFPFVTTARDPLNNRVLVCFPQSRLIYSENRCDTVMTRPVVVAVKPDKSYEVLYTLTDCVNRSLTRSPLFLATGGLYVLYSFIDPDCGYFWKLALNDKTWTLGDADYSQCVASSDDGWFAFANSSGQIVLDNLNRRNKGHK